MVLVKKSKNFLDGEYIKEKKKEKIVIVDEPILSETKYGEKLQCRVSVNGEEFLWTMNNTSKDILIDVFGDDTKEWIKKEIPIEVTKIHVGSDIKLSITVVT